MVTQHQKNQIKHLHELRRFTRARVRILRKEYLEVAHVGKLGAYSSDSDFDDWKARRALRDYIQHRYDLARAELKAIEAEYQVLRSEQSAAQSANQAAVIDEPFPGPFTWAAHVSGDYDCTFHFHNLEDLAVWMKSDFLKIKENYGKLTIKQERLTGLSIGDICRVWGDGINEYKIVGFEKWSTHYYGFVLDSGCVESVHKCY